MIFVSKTGVLHLVQYRILLILSFIMLRMRADWSIYCIYG